MTVARFKVYGRDKEFGKHGAATVTIDRNNNFISVRPLKRRRTYELRLEDVAAIIIDRVVKSELAEKKKAKVAKRKMFGR